MVNSVYRHVDALIEASGEHPRGSKKWVKTEKEMRRMLAILLISNYEMPFSLTRYLKEQQERIQNSRSRQEIAMYEATNVRLVKHFEEVFRDHARYIEILKSLVLPGSLDYRQGSPRLLATYTELGVIY